MVHVLVVFHQFRTYYVHDQYSLQVYVPPVPIFDVAFVYITTPLVWFTTYVPVTCYLLVSGPSSYESR